jgi:AcrR family transcriptional regulator
MPRRPDEVDRSVSRLAASGEGEASVTGSASARDDRSARSRIIDAAYDLFTREGIHSVGIDRVIAEAGVAKMTLYRHFRSKDDLVVAALARRHEVWTEEWLEQEVERRAKAPAAKLPAAKLPAAKLLAIFDTFADWFDTDDYEGCFFIKSLLESHDRTSPVREASSLGLARARSFVRGLAEEAGAEDPDDLARQWQLLMTGAIVAASDDDRAAAGRARALGVLLLEREGLGP